MPCQTGDGLPALLAGAGQKTHETGFLRGQPAKNQRSKGRGGPGQHLKGQPPLYEGGYQPLPGVGYAGQPGVGHEGDGLALRHPPCDLLRPALLVVLVAGYEGLGYPQP